MAASSRWSVATEPCVNTTTVRCAAPAGTPCTSRSCCERARCRIESLMTGCSRKNVRLQEGSHEKDANEDNEDTATLVHHQTARSVPGGEGVGTTIPVAPNGVGCVSLSGMDGVVERRDGRMFARCASF